MRGALLTCLIIGETPASQAVAQQLTEWSDNQYLGRLALVRISEASGIPGPVPQVPVTLPGVTGPSQPDELLHMIAAGPWTRLMFITLLDTDLPQGGIGATHDLHEFSLELISELKRAMPASPDGRQHAGMTLTTLRLIAPASGQQDFPPDWARFDQRWDHTMVLAPEDRASPYSVADHVRWPGNYPSHVAGAIAVLGGLWIGMDRPAAPVPDPTDDGSGPDLATCRVVRTQARVAAAPTPIEKIRDEIMGIARGSRDYPEGTLVQLRFATTFRARSLLDEAFRNVKNHPSRTLSYDTISDESLRPDYVKRADILDSFWRFAFGEGRRGGQGRIRFAGAMAEPVKALRKWVTITIDDLFGRALAGEGAGIVVRTSLVDEMVREWESEWQEILQKEAERESPQQEPDDAAQFWTTLRREVLGLVDGSRGAAAGEFGEAVDVVADRSMVVGPEAPRFSPTSLHCLGQDNEISPFNIWASEGALSYLRRAAETLEPEAAPEGEDDEETESEAQPEAEFSEQPEAEPGSADLVEQGDRELREVDRERIRKKTDQPPARKRAWTGVVTLVLAFVGVAAAGLLWFRDDRVPAVVLGVLSLLLLLWSIRDWRRSRKLAAGARAESSDATAQTLSRSSHPLHSKAVELEGLEPSDAFSLSEDVSTFTAWLESFRSTFLGRLATHAAQETDRARFDYRDRVGEYRRLENLSTSELRHRRGSWFFWFWFGPLALVSGYVLMVWWYQEQTAPTISILDVAHVDVEAMLVIGLVLWTLVFGGLYINALLAYHRAYRKTRHSMVERALAAATLARRLEHAKRETRRLDPTNVTLARWAEVFTHVVRAPYGDRNPVPDAAGSADAREEDEPLSASADTGEEAVKLDRDETLPTGPGLAPLLDEPSAPQVPVRTSSLSTQIATVTTTPAYVEGELRRAVGVALSMGWLHETFRRLVTFAFQDLGMGYRDAIRRMDRDLSEPKSYVELFADRLAQGDCQDAAAENLEDRLLKHRAEIEETSGSGFLTMPIEGRNGPTTVETFLAELTASGTAMRADLFRADARVDILHGLGQELLWTHSHEEAHSGVPPGGPRIFLEDVEPQEERIQLVAARLDATPALEPSRLSCFGSSDRARDDLSAYRESQDLV